MSVVNQLDAQFLFYNKFISYLYMFRAHVLIIRRSKLHYTYRCEDTRGCVMQFWPPDNEHVCSKHVEAWNKLIVKQKFCASSWLITEINILRCTVSKTSKLSIRQLLKCIFNHISQLHVSVRPPGAIFIFLVCRMYLSAFTSKEVSFFFKLCLCFIYDSRVECVVFSWCYSLLLS